MSDAARKILQDVLTLPEDERLELASEIIASVDGPRDADWDAAWLAELDRRTEAAKDRGESGADWTDVESDAEEELSGRSLSRTMHGRACGRPAALHQTAAQCDAAHTSARTLSFAKATSNEIA